MKPMRAFVINLERRPDRLQAFMQHMQQAGMDQVFQFETFKAVEGRDLDLEAFRHRVSPANWAQIDRLRGHLGCSLSHLECWRQIAAGQAPAAVFEDDARIVSGIGQDLIRAALQDMPRGAGLVWLNEYNYWQREPLMRKLQRKLRSALGLGPAAPRSVAYTPMPDVLTTMESYVVAPDFAQRMYEGVHDSLGAIDRQVQAFVARSGRQATQCHPPLFTQADRSDSATQI